MDDDEEDDDDEHSKYGEVCMNFVKDMEKSMRQVKGRQSRAHEG